MYLKISVTLSDMYVIIQDKMKDFDVQINPASWTVMRDWCLAATQPRHAEHFNSSHLECSIDAVTTNDIPFHSWALSRLTLTLGPRLSSQPGQHTPSAFPPQAEDRRQHLSDKDDLATQVGRGIALGFQAMTGAGLSVQGTEA